MRQIVNKAILSVKWSLQFLKTICSALWGLFAEARSSGWLTRLQFWISCVSGNLCLCFPTLNTVISCFLLTNNMVLSEHMKRLITEHHNQQTAPCLIAANWPVIWWYTAVVVQWKLLGDIWTKTMTWPVLLHLYSLPFSFLYVRICCNLVKLKSENNGWILSRCWIFSWIFCYVCPDFFLRMIKLLLL